MSGVCVLTRCTESTGKDWRQAPTVGVLVRLHQDSGGLNNGELAVLVAFSVKVDIGGPSEFYGEFVHSILSGLWCSRGSIRLPVNHM